jgi:hypothetical protein
MIAIEHLRLLRGEPAAKNRCVDGTGTITDGIDVLEGIIGRHKMVEPDAACVQMS